MVLLRPWRKEDAPAVTAACQDPEIPRFTRVPSPYGEEDARSFIGEVLRGDAPGVQFAIAGSAGGELLGSAAVWPVHEPQVGEIGYWVAAPARGGGVATRAVRLLSRYALDELEMVWVQLMIEPENVASMRVAEKAGFEREGLLRSWANIKGSRRDLYSYSLLRQ